MKQFLILFSLLFTTVSWGQVIDSFDDGDFTNNPTWTGNVDDFIINDNLELQLHASGAGESYLSTSHNLSSLDDIEWRFKIQYKFAPSNSNYGLTYLSAEQADLATLPDGIFFRIGRNGAEDAIELFERNGGTDTPILTGTVGAVSDVFISRVKIIYHASGDWELFTDYSGGEAYQLDASANHPISFVGEHLGFFLKYSASRSEHFYFDDIYAGEIEIDETPPSVDTVFASSNSIVDVLFNEAIDPISGENELNYFVNNGIGNPGLVLQDENNQALFHLIFSTAFEVGQEYQLTVENVADYQGNTMGSETRTFVYIESQTPEFGDILINEFIPKPSPPQGLPESQFIELYNRSNKYFNLKDWLVSDNQASGYIGNDVWMFPGDYLILVPSAGMAVYPNATKVTSWSVLNVAGDEIHLHTPDGILVDELTYTDAWYKDDAKKAGGWSIERINPELFCSSADNWRASTDPLGGTPGGINSVVDATPDTIAPTVIHIEPILPSSIIITFSEGMDSLSLVHATFTATGLTIANRIIQGAYPIQLQLEFNEILQAGHLYNFTLENFFDCSGNTTNYTGTFVVPQIPVKGDLIINEILFNPLTGGSDFVEIYNNSHKYIDIKNWELANYKDDTIANNKVVNHSYVIPPNDYLVLTKDTNFQIMNYPFAIPGKFVQTDLPAYNNDSSTVFLIYGDSIMDKVSYEENWHFSLLYSKKGVSLERFSPDEPSNTPANWHSASETYGFATPGRENSQFMGAFNEGGTLSLSSSTFSPDNDGFEDVLVLSYEVSSPDLLGDLIVYDDKGRKIKTLFEQHLLGSTGSVKWEGTKDNGTKASIGPYIIVFDIFNLESSKVESIRKVVTLAGKL